MIEYLVGLLVVLAITLAASTYCGRQQNKENKRLLKSNDECNKYINELAHRCQELEKQTTDAKAQTGARIGQLNIQKQEYSKRKEQLKKEINAVLNKY